MLMEAVLRSRSNIVRVCVCVCVCACDIQVLIQEEKVGSQNFYRMT